ncbi:hypothetical protein Salat_2161400 [Sesamum alatum]|uniref:DUF4283 domain-containing protein n=1 Tax=Sesamum alatum TaxID=300844 RepID=A0AAE2CHE2_9LAMI|nr:hypothetical protein Salat_2161400 [Sesamum alatum]
MDSKLDRLGKALRLMEEEDATMVILDLKQTGHATSRAWFLCGRMITHRPGNFEALQNYLISTLNPIKGLEVSNIGEGCFLIRFNHRVDRDKVMGVHGRSRRIC